MTQHLYILTGGSRGMGLAIAEQLLQAGNTLICISRNQQASLTVKAQQAGAHLEQWTHDLADGATASAALKSWLEKQSAQNFQSATLINNAGVIPHITPLSQADPHLVVIDLSRNFGKEAAMTAGLEAVRGDVVILMDADGQHPASLLPVMLQHWREGSDVVYAVRRTRSSALWSSRERRASVASRRPRRAPSSGSRGRCA